MRKLTFDEVFQICGGFTHYGSSPEEYKERKDKELAKYNENPLDPEKYIGPGNGPDWGNAKEGHTTIKVLTELEGKPWDEVALGFCYAVKPSCIRVTDGPINLDAMDGRLTVYLEEKDGKKVIRECDQEVTIKTHPLSSCGYDTMKYLQTGKHVHLFDDPCWAEMDGELIQMMGMKENVD